MDSSTSSIITALGAGSGVNMAALASNLAEAQFATRIEQLRTRSDDLQAKISAASDLKSQVTQLASALGERVRAGDLAPTPRVANGAVASVARASGTSPAGNYSLEVFSLAGAQTLAGPVYPAATSTVGAGTLTLRFGAVDGGTFTADAAHDAVDIAIPVGATLKDVANAINAAKTGVSAYVANGADGAQLVLKGAEGANNGFVIEAAETPGQEGLAALAWQPPSGDPARLLTGSADAQFALDGIAMTSPSNKAGGSRAGHRPDVDRNQRRQPDHDHFRRCLGSDPVDDAGSYVRSQRDRLRAQGRD